MSKTNFNINVPTNIIDNIDFRKKLIFECGRKPDLAAAVKKLFNSDPLFAFKAFFFTYDPRPQAIGHHLPFLPYEFQVDMIYQLMSHIERGKDLVLLKSRDMGATWVTISVLLWYWLKCIPGYDFLLGSRKEELVDKRGDTSTLFEKFRYNIHRLPEFLLPPGYDPKVHDTHMSIINPESGGILRGEANNQYFGTGARYRAVVVDEFAKWEHTDNAAWTSLGDVTPSRIAISTPVGRNNKFADLVLNKDDIKIDTLRLHWTLHPEKDDKWYEVEKARRSDMEVAQELDLSFEGSAGQRFFKEYNVSLHRVNDLEIIPGREVFVGLDFGYIHPAMIATQFDTSDRWLWHRSILGRDVDVETFVKYCWKKLIKWFPTSSFNFSVDIAGAQRSDKAERTSIQVLRDIVEGQIVFRKIDREDINVKIRELFNTNRNGKPAILISNYKQPDNESLPSFIEREDMEYIHEALMGGIHYASNSKVIKEDWEKEKFYEHGMDALGFIVYNHLIDHLLPSKLAELKSKFAERNSNAQDMWGGIYGHQTASRKTFSRLGKNSRSRGLHQRVF